MEIFLEGNKEGAHHAVEANAIAILVDTLRASTTMPVTMSKGLDTLYVVREVEDTRIAAKELNAIMMGERGCIPLEGFSFGNSPTEMYNLTQLQHKAAIFTSSTGAKITTEAIGAQYIIIGSPINAEAVVKKVKQILDNTKDDISIVIIPTFSEGSIINSEITEDQLGGLIIAKEFQKAGFELNSKITEELDYLELLLQNSSLEQLFLETKHGKKLLELGYSHDVEFCSRINYVDTVPLSKNQIHTLQNGVKIVRLQKE